MALILVAQIVSVPPPGSHTCRGSVYHTSLFSPDFCSKTTGRGSVTFVVWSHLSHCDIVQQSALLAQMVPGSPYQIPAESARVDHVT
ncbi:hypothetical protein J6590_008925 [Homalodisca vitripennis]|nr:hypothetical protein J6590_008925 [Homalodisca vitripennis]